MVDFPTWAGPAPRHHDRPCHAHNRLIASITTPPDDRSALARAMGDSLAQARAPVTAILPLRGIQQWDQPGEPLCESESRAAFIDEFRSTIRPPATLVEVDGHINDQTFSDTVLAVLDDRIALGIVLKARSNPINPN